MALGLYEQPIALSQLLVRADSLELFEQAPGCKGPSKMMMVRGPEVSRASDGAGEVAIDGFSEQIDVIAGEIAGLAHLFVEQALRLVIVAERRLLASLSGRQAVRSLPQEGQQSFHAWNAARIAPLQATDFVQPLRAEDVRAEHRAMDEQQGPDAGLGQFAPEPCHFILPGQRVRRRAGGEFPIGQPFTRVRSCIGLMLKIVSNGHGSFSYLKRGLKRNGGSERPARFRPPVLVKFESFS